MRSESVHDLDTYHKTVKLSSISFPIAGNMMSHEPHNAECAVLADVCRCGRIARGYKESEKEKKVKDNHNLQIASFPYNQEIPTLKITPVD